MANLDPSAQKQSAVTFWWNNPVRAAAAILSGFVVLLSTVVPISVAGRAVYDTQVALDCVIAIGALWAVVFGYENIKAFNDARLAELTPLLDISASRDHSSPPTLVVLNVGKGSAVIDSLHYWLMDWQQNWQSVPLKVSSPVLQGGQSLSFEVHDFARAAATSSEIPVRLCFHSAISRSVATHWFKFRSTPRDFVFDHLEAEEVSAAKRLRMISEMTQRINGGVGQRNNAAIIHFAETARTIIYRSEYPPVTIHHTRFATPTRIEGEIESAILNEPSKLETVLYGREG